MIAAPAASSHRACDPRETRMPAVRWISVATLVFLMLHVGPVRAQPLGQPPAHSGSPTPAVASAGGSVINLLVGRSTLLDIGGTITRVSLTTPDVADAMVTTPQQLLIHGKTPGTISLFVWDKSGAIKTFDVTVRRDLGELGERLRQLFPGESIEVASTGKDVVLSGTVSSKHVLERAVDVAAGYVEKKENVVNLLQQPEGVASTQIMLQVRFAEVSRNALQELGASFFAHGARNGEWFGRTTTQQFPSPVWDREGRLIFSDFLNLFVFNAAEGLGSVIRAMQSRGLFQSLAEPNLIALNGREASFLAGGEYPYPVVQGTGDRVALTIMFKEFGVRLSFTPTIVNGDLIHLRVRPEVSSLDFSNGLIMDGFRIPALSTRRTETEVELRHGQTFAIAGLMNNEVTQTMQKMPGIGDIPILGALFRSRALQKGQTELVVMITPHILPPGSPGVSSEPPQPVTPFLDPPRRTIPMPPPAFPRPQGSVQPAPSPQLPVLLTSEAEPQTAAPAVQAGVPLHPGSRAATSAQVPANGQGEAAGREAERQRPAALEPDASIARQAQAEEQKRQAEADERLAAEARKAVTQQQRLARELRKQQEKAAREEQKAARAAQRREAQRASEEQKRKAAQERRQAQAERQVKRDAQRQEEEARTRARLLAEAEAKLKAAQAAYEAELTRVQDRAHSDAAQNGGHAGSPQR